MKQSIKISILSESIAGIVVYAETHNATSNSSGMVNIAIGNGQDVSGDLTVIDWGRSKYFVKAEADILQVTIELPLNYY